MMLLAVDTTASVATAALFCDGILLGEKEADATKKHAETVLPLIDDLLEQNGVSISQIDLFAVDIGPGSFTGVRIGVSIINALAFASGKSIIPVDALRTLAQSVGEATQPICAMIDARNGNAYAALYQAGETLIEPCAVEIESFLSKLPSNTLHVGDVRTTVKSYPRAKQVGMLALLDLDAAVKETEPIYLRASQAERLKKTAAGEENRECMR